MAHMRPMTTLLDVPIRFDVGDGVTHAPMVDVVVAGHRTRLILDTGSTDHVITMALVLTAGLRHEPGEPGTDHAGASVESWSVGDLEVVIDGVVFALHDVVAITGPTPFEGWGIGGVLSPQHLHPSASVIVDLIADRLILVDGQDADIAAWLRARTLDRVALPLDRDPSEATPIVSAAIEPYRPVATMLNTGGRGTEFAISAVPGLSGVAPADLGKGVGGDPVLGTVVAGRTLRVGDARFPVARLLVRDEIDTAQGLIGMDVLRGTVLMLSADRRRPVWWLVPGEPGG